MTLLFALLALLGSVALAAVWLTGRLATSRAALRLETVETGRLAVGPAVDALRPGEVEAGSGVLGPSRRIAAMAVVGIGLAVAFACRIGLGWSLSIAGAIAFDASILAALVLATRREQRALRLEEQLAQLLRMTSASLRAGLGRIDALGRSASQIGDPLAGVLKETVGRLRLGEDPERAFDHLARHVPLESFRLFAMVIATQWHAGGSLQNTLGSIGDFMQDRVDVARRIRAQASPTRSSVLTLVAATAAIAYFSHANDPANLERFLRSEWGDRLISAALALQGGALVWIWRLTRTTL